MRFLVDEKIIIPELSSLFENLVKRICDFSEPLFKDVIYQRVHGDAHKGNIKRLNEVLIRALIDYFKIPIICSRTYNEIDKDYYHNMVKYGNAGMRLQANMKLLMNDKYHFLDFLFAYMEAYRAHYSEEAKTIDDLKEFAKILKKG